MGVESGVSWRVARIAIDSAPKLWLAAGALQLSRVYVVGSSNWKSGELKIRESVSTIAYPHSLVMRADPSVKTVSEVFRAKSFSGCGSGGKCTDKWDVVGSRDWMLSGILVSSSIVFGGGSMLGARLSLSLALLSCVSCSCRKDKAFVMELWWGL